MTDIVFKGVTIEPFGSYLKALGMFKIIAEQYDPNTRSRWTPDGLFCLKCKGEADDIVDFFMNIYSPSPIANPWSGGSGFYPGDNRSFLEIITASNDSRLQDYRLTIQAIEKVMSRGDKPANEEVVKEERDLFSREVGCPPELATNDVISAKLKELGIKTDLAKRLEDAMVLVNIWDGLQKDGFLSDMKGLTLEETISYIDRLDKKDRDKKKRLKELVKEMKKRTKKENRKFRDENKSEIVKMVRSVVPDRALDWIDAATRIDDNDEFRPFPILLTGGNEGNMDYGRVFMGNVICALLDDMETSKKWLRGALFNEEVSNLPKSPVGYIDPGRAGGYNQGQGIESKDFPTNPWDFILAMEGCTLWAGNIVRRGENSISSASSPFTVKNVAVGYTSASEADERNAKSEIWAPIWTKDVGLPEFRFFMSEGRADVGNKRASTAIEFAEAVGTLGTDRGVVGYCRYGIMLRRGKSYASVPLGRYAFGLRKEAEIIMQVNPILERVGRWLSDFDDSPKELKSSIRRVEQSMMEALNFGGPVKTIGLLMSLGQLEMEMTKRKSDDRPFIDKALGGEWLIYANDGSIEFRIASALASIGPTESVYPISGNLGLYFDWKNKKWSNEQLSWNGRDLYSKMANTVIRRVMDAEKAGISLNPFQSKLRVTPNDIDVFIKGNVDKEKIERLLHGMCLLRWGDIDRGLLQEVQSDFNNKVGPMRIDRTWAILKMTFLSDPIVADSGEEIELKADAKVVPLLLAGRGEEAIKTVSRQLYLAGFNKVNVAPIKGTELSLAASLLIPVESKFYKDRRIKTILWS
ncbi:MAG: type I-U CRISPR-associated protein Csx17 [Methanomassiliicoccales archaeon]|nr:MAG: type I-U CRISPR-associated protein Csx17 [Methanomassiliicoccales archaeon]